MKQIILFFGFVTTCHICIAQEFRYSHPLFIPKAKIAPKVYKVPFGQNPNSSILKLHVPKHIITTTPNLKKIITLPLDNMPCIASTIESNMPVLKIFGNPYSHPVPIPNRKFDFPGLRKDLP